MTITANTGSTSNDRDVIYALRTTHQYQTNLINLADHKANILIGLSLVSFSILLTKATWVLEQEGVRLSAITAYAVLQLATVLTAIWVVLPKMGKYLTINSLDEAPNPTFFGYFTQFSQAEFVKYTAQHMQHDQDARTLLLRDIYQIGQVLKSKYATLRMAYLLQTISILILFSGVIFQLSQ